MSVTSCFFKRDGDSYIELSDAFNGPSGSGTM